MTKILTIKQIEEIKKRADAATQGPWQFDEPCNYPDEFRALLGSGDAEVIGSDDYHNNCSVADQLFIKNSRMDIPALIKSHEELRKMVDLSLVPTTVTATEVRKRDLDREIADAKTSIAERPEWMKRAAHFRGSEGIRKDWKETDKKLAEAREEQREAKNHAYRERQQLVAYLSRVYPAHMKRHPEEDKDWENDWRNIVCIHSPAGQMTWHIHDSEVWMFGHLNAKSDPFKACVWDGHTGEEKYRRLAGLPLAIRNQGEEGAKEE